MNGRSAYIAVAALALLGLGLTSASAEPKYGPGASDTEIKIGNTGPYSGPLSAYGAIAHAQAKLVVRDAGVRQEDV